jgi:predicted metal-dependent hydrolase
VIGMTLQIVVSLLGDPESYRRRKLRASLRRFRQSPLVSRQLWEQLRDYDRPDFHPDDRDTTELVERWRTELFGEYGTLNDRLARTAV